MYTQSTKIEFFAVSLLERLNKINFSIKYIAVGHKRSSRPNIGFTGKIHTVAAL